MRLIIQDIEAVLSIIEMPNLPVARVMCKTLSSLTTEIEIQISAGGAYHTVSYDEMLKCL